MALYTKAVINTTTVTTTIIINTKRTESKIIPNILSFQRSIPFQSQLKVYIYILYEYTVYPLIGLEFLSEGKRKRRGPSFSQNFKNCSC